MNVSLKFFLRIKRKFISAVLRGHFELLRSQNFGRVHLLRVQISEAALKVCSKNEKNTSDGEKYFFGQFFYTKVLNIHFNKMTLCAMGGNARLTYPLPKFSREIIEKNGIPVNHFISGLSWYGFLLLWILWSIIKVFYFSILYVLSASLRTRKKVGPLIFLSINDDLALNGGLKTQHNLATWAMHHVYGKTKNPVFFMGRFGKKIPGFTNINSIQGLQAGFYPKDFSSLLKFQYKSFSAILSGIGSSLMGSSSQLVALPYKIEQLAFVYSSIDSSFSFCSNLSSVHLKPLWSETAEARGCKVFCCLYSTNLIFPPTEVQPHVPLGWQFVTWNEILVWDEQQAQYLRSILPLKSTKLRIVGPIPFVDKNRPKAIREKKKKIISVFSVTPRRLYRFAEVASGGQYYQGAKSIEFLRHIGEVTHLRGFKCCLKEKREFGNNVNKSYLNEVSNLNTMGWTIYPSDWSTTFLIKNSDLVICLPFTSVALEAKILDVAAVFYDPGGDIIDPQRYSHGVPVVGSKKDLSALIETLI